MARPLGWQDLRGWSGLRLWAGWVMGPAAWAMHESGGYAILPAICATGTDWPLHALTALTLVLALGGALVSWRLLGRTRASDLPEATAARARLLLLVGIGLSLGSVVGILLESLASWTLDPCTGL